MTQNNTNTVTTIDLSKRYVPRVGTLKELSKLYDIEETHCGKGGFGTVFKATSKGVAPCPVPAGEVVAIKKIPDSKYTGDNASKRIMLNRELAIMPQLNHPNIVKFKDCMFMGSLTAPTCVYIVMEFVGGGDLFSAVTSSPGGFLPEKRARRYFQHLMNAVAYLHSNNVAHRDIKLENLLLDPTTDTAKLADFGFVKQSALVTTACTAEYAAYEIVQNHILPEQQRVEYQKQVDLWACGVALFCALAGRYPFGTRESPTLINDIMSLRYNMSSKISAGAADLIRGLLQPPENRISLEAVFQHPWFLLDYEPLTAPIPAAAPAAAATAASKAQEANAAQNQEQEARNNNAAAAEEATAGAVTKPAAEQQQAQQQQQANADNKRNEPEPEEFEKPQRCSCVIM